VRAGVRNYNVAAREYGAARTEAQAVLAAEPGNAAATALLANLPPP
jgi:hypothetical protein